MSPGLDREIGQWHLGIKSLITESTETIMFVHDDEVDVIILHAKK